jgi:hypothetical protein
LTIPCALDKLTSHQIPRLFERARSLPILAGISLFRGNVKRSFTGVKNMDSLDIENLLAGPLGIRMGKRGDVNDADFVRANDPKLLAKALTKILARLEKRAEKMKESETKAWIEKELEDLSSINDVLKEQRSEVKGVALFLLWGTSATALGSVHLQLKAEGV